ncbi:MAG: hypothetical protein F6K65_12350 [Moorea sp. SIO3C2]|nr:hypothetical protein [Moorena sp. SIO3C2]
MRCTPSNRIQMGAMHWSLLINIGKGLMLVGHPVTASPGLIGAVTLHL